MIESMILGSAAGIQRQGVIDKTESTVLPSLSNGVIVGRFKRGRMDKPFKVNSDNYRALLGHDPSNPSYLAVEDCFKRGVSEISILRTSGVNSVGPTPTNPSSISYLNMDMPPEALQPEIGLTEVFTNKSAMLKTEFNDTGQLIHHFSYNIPLPPLPSGSIPLDVNDVIITTLFNNIYLNLGMQDSVLSYAAGSMKNVMPAIANTTKINPPQVGMFHIESPTTTPNHSNTVSIAAYNESKLRAMLSEPYKVFDPDLYARLQTAPIEQLPEILQLSENIGALVEVVKNPKLTITRVTASEADLVSIQHTEVPPFFDAFDLIKERVNRQESALNDLGYSTAIYTDNGGDGSNDTIVFTGEYAMSILFSNPVLPEAGT